MGLFDVKKENVNEIPEVVECDKQLGLLGQRKTDLFLQIGRMYAENTTIEDAAGTCYEEKLKELAEIDKQMNVQEKRKLAAQGLRKCSKCGNVLVLDSIFCNKCGDKLEPLFEEPVQENKNVCSNCGAAYAEGAMFCTSCGNKLG